MTNFSLHPQLEKDCHILGKLDLCHILLLNNALVPWFILVPETSITEFHKLEQQQQHLLLAEINRISGFIENNFDVTKLNTATIGNIVRQMHIHIIGRHEKDFAWPGVV
ncbi:MAG TPA: HIT domain-containing protein, partial [Gammaproteobacteria bacterium]